MDPARDLAAEYSAKALEYAQHWAPVIGPMALPLLRALPLEKAARVLDVGAGCGTLVPALRAAAPAARLFGIDSAEGMLRIAQRSERLDCAVMDAERLALGTGSFDVALLIFVLFHLPQPQAALRELNRVLREGGTVGVVAWGEDPGVPGFDIWAEELAACGAAPDPRHPSVMQHELMDTPVKLERLLRETGFDAGRLWCEHFEHRWTLPALFAMQTGSGVASRRLPSLPPEVQEACKRRVRARLARLHADELVYRPQVIFAVGRRRPVG